MKHISEISWLVDEPTYRKHPALSQSNLAKFEREGFSSLPTLFDHVETPSLIFGSVVDELITGDAKSFKNRFIVADFPKLQPQQETAVKRLAEVYGKDYMSMDKLSDAQLLSVLDECAFNKHLLEATRIKKIKETACVDYFRLLCACSDKKVITQDVYDTAAECAQKLKGDPATKAYFGRDDDDVKHYYQLKFKNVIDGVEYRGMLDLVIVDYKRKVVVPCDLKTTSSLEYEFYDSFMHWRYDIQARLYWRLLRMAMDADDYFKDFRLADFRFICINKQTKEPLVWYFDKVRNEKDIIIGNRKLRAPWTIGSELRYYLDKHPKVPSGIKKVGLNSITEHLEKKYCSSAAEDGHEADEAG